MLLFILLLLWAPKTAKQKATSEWIASVWEENKTNFIVEINIFHI